MPSYLVDLSRDLCPYIKQSWCEIPNVGSMDGRLLPALSHHWANDVPCVLHLDRRSERYLKHGDQLYCAMIKQICRTWISTWVQWYMWSQRILTKSAWAHYTQQNSKTEMVIQHFAFAGQDHSQFSILYRYLPKSAFIWVAERWFRSGCVRKTDFKPINIVVI